MNTKKLNNLLKNNQFKKGGEKMKILFKTLKNILYIIVTIFTLIGIYFIVNGGGQAFIAEIQTSGFFKFVADFLLQFGMA